MANNLILKAAKAFVVATGWMEPVAFRLDKRIPVGAGLGGGSSNATATLLALNQLSGATLGVRSWRGWPRASGPIARCFWRRAGHHAGPG